ncbi:hypothetical protein L1987_27512 [Smallanthus sonchifolius]|uniref:Uncharacterized protein n=1 Tax=Smallanthus sonchifolius TaxID=185202 RepID=A0ACB9IBY4_9ASTR|nr:hypothetical protein L1987_27512 [Smallanthus sonchifolius]
MKTLFFLYGLVVILQALKAAWQNTPPTWDGSDPCGGSWESITCKNCSVTTIAKVALALATSSGDLFPATFPNTLGSMQLKGELPGDIGQFTELQILDLSYNKGLTGSLPSQIGNLRKLTNFFNLTNLYWLDLSANKLTGRLPVSNGITPGLDMLTHAGHLFLSNNQLTGPIPDLTGMNVLNYLDLSNNTFDQSDVPSWFSTLQALTTIKMHSTSLGGEVPAALFSIPQLENVDLSNNRINGTLNISSNPSTQLELVDLRSNQIVDFTQRHRYNIGLILVRNPICWESGVQEGFCSLPTNTTSSYSTPRNNCVTPSCGSGLVSSPNCRCALPYTGLFFFKAPSFSSVGNSTIYISLQDSLMTFFQKASLPVDSLSMNNPSRNSDDYLVINLDVFPSGGEPWFNRTGILGIGFALSNPTFRPSKLVVVLLLVLARVYAFRRKEQAKSIAQQSQPFVAKVFLSIDQIGEILAALWDQTSGSGGVPQLKGVRSFTVDKLQNYTNNFSKINYIGKVYKGSLPNGQLIAVKRAEKR